jgi:hypothetical protein
MRRWIMGRIVIEALAMVALGWWGSFVILDLIKMVRFDGSLVSKAGIRSLLYCALHCCYVFVNAPGHI